MNPTRGSSPNCATGPSEPPASTPRLTGSESATPAGDGAAASGGDEPSLRGTVDSIVYVTVDGSFAVVRLRSEADPAARPVAVGPLAGVRPGELLHLQGAWTHHRRHGPQFKVTSFHSVAPTTAAGIERFLASRLVKGVGPALAKRIVARFGTGALEVLDRRGERLTEVAGIGPDRRDRILASWADHRQLRDVMIFLQGHGISPAYALRIHRRYGAAARRAVTENPYRLAEEVAGIGFLIADRIAASLGVDPHSPERAAAGVLHVLGTGVDKAIAAAEHGCLPPPEFRAEANATRTILFGARRFAEMTLKERQRACYQHAVLRYLDGSRMRNSTLRERLGVAGRNSAQISGVIRHALKAELIRPADPARPRSGYVPFWA